MIILRMLLFLCIFLGGGLYVKRHFKVELLWAPVIYLCGVNVLLFVFGLLNMLNIGVIIISVASLLCGMRELIFNPSLLIKLNQKEIWLFIAVLGGLAWFFNGAILLGYDDFSHWGLMVREMLVYGRLPNFENTIIGFTSYPPGTALHIYFVSYLVGQTEGIMLWAQSVYTVSMAVVLLTIVPKRDKLLIGAMSLFILFLMTSVHRLTSLSVDPLLSLLSIAAIIIAYQSVQKRHISNNKILGVIFTALVLIKHSGVFFYGISALLVLYLQRRYLSKQQDRFYLFMPLLSVFLWRRHVSFAFGAGSSSKHAVNLASYRNIASSKSVTEIITIVRAMLHKMTDVYFYDNKVLLVLVSVFFLMLIIKKWHKISIRRDIYFFGVSVALYGVYQLLLLSMYIFSMPMHEAQNVASYSRYNMTMIAILSGLLAIYLIETIKKRPKIKELKGVFIVSSILLTMLSRSKIIDHININEDVYTHRMDLIDIKEAGNILWDEASIVLLVDKEELKISEDLLKYIAKYEFRTADITTVSEDEWNSVDISQYEGSYLASVPYRDSTEVDVSFQSEYLIPLENQIYRIEKENEY